MGILSVPTEECLIPAESGLSVSGLGYSSCKGQISVNETAWLHSEMCTCVFFLSERRDNVFLCNPGWPGICRVSQAGFESVAVLCIAWTGLEFPALLLAQPSEPWLEPSHLAKK